MAEGAASASAGCGKTRCLLVSVVSATGTVQSVHTTQRRTQVHTTDVRPPRTPAAAGMESDGPFHVRQCPGPAPHADTSRFAHGLSVSVVPGVTPHTHKLKHRSASQHTPLMTRLVAVAT